MKIYVVVHVRYDYHRFQDNLFASVNKQDCIVFIKEEHDSAKIIEGVNDNCVGNDDSYYWIQEFQI